MTSPIREIPISLKYSLFKSSNMSFCMRFSVKVRAYVADTSDGIPAAVKKFTHMPETQMQKLIIIEIISMMIFLLSQLPKHVDVRFLWPNKQQSSCSYLITQRRSPGVWHCGDRIGQLDTESENHSWRLFSCITHGHWLVILTLTLEAASLNSARGKYNVIFI